MNEILKKLSYSFFSNTFSATISIFMVLVLPKVMSMEDYGIWQLFVFYFSYSGFLHLGWLDGIYLRYGGQYYDELDRKIFGGQFFLLLAFLIAECLMINVLLDVCLMQDEILRFIIKLISVGALIVNLRSFVEFIFQLSNRIKEYARNIVLERALFIVSIIVCIATGNISYKDIVCALLFSSFVVMCFGIYLERDLLFCGRAAFKLTINETCDNINSGIKLMLSNISGMLILGIIRFGISQGWDIVTFGKISLTLSISNFMMIFVSAVSVVLFPILKRSDTAKLTKVYVFIRRFLSYSMLLLLLSYYPLRYILLQWLPKYSDSLFYMGIMFPVCIFESKMQVLVNTYLKSLRQELLMLKINIIAVIVAVLSTYITVVVLHDLQLAIITIVTNFAFRLLVAEYYVEKLLAIQLRSEGVQELALVLFFIAVNIATLDYSLLIYAAVCVGFYWYNREHIKTLLIKLWVIVRNIK